MLEKIVKKSSLMAPILAIALSAADANAADITKEQIKQELAQKMRKINSTYFVNNPQDKRRGYWGRIVNLIDSGEEVVLLQENGKTYFAVDGWGQVLNKKHQQLSTKNHTLDLSERIPNFTVPFTEGTMPEDKHYAFEGLAKLPQDKPTVPETLTPTVPTPITPKPAKEDLPFLLFSPGISYLQIFSAEDEMYGFDGNLHGASLSLTVQPSFTNWYWGGRFSAYYGSGSNSVDLNAPATEGPLAGQLVMLGKNDYSLEQFGIGIGSMAGYMIPFEKEGRFGLGLELEHGIMHDWVTRKFGESSAHYINGNLVEGTNIFNNSDDTDTTFSGYATVGLRWKLGPVCLIPAGGFRTDFSNVDGMFSAGAAYCPNKE